ncbi:hypothetical protein, partial [Xylella fastidiosa]|uniref:hypothetical protein n=1 Tax=Xylella fastidiosa TaxID=2371 RepID=UPI001EEA64BD
CRARGRRCLGGGRRWRGCSCPCSKAWFGARAQGAGYSPPRMSPAFGLLLDFAAQGTPAT